MTERALPMSAPADGRSAGTLLREARLARGLDVASLAGQMKVPVAKIEAIEADRLEALPGLAFTRGLALAICRALKVDAQPVLDRLPRSDGHTLDDVSRGINAPFREPRGGWASLDFTLLRRPIVWGPLVFAVGALLLWWVPAMPLGDVALSAFAPRPGGADTAAAPAQASATPASTAVVAPGAAAPSAAPYGPPGAGTSPPGLAGSAGSAASGPADGTRIEVVHAAPAVAAAIAASAPSDAAAATAAAGDPAAGVFMLRSSGTSWVEVRDARGAVLLSRTLQPGESVSLIGTLPLQAVVGNASQTQAFVRGQALDIAASTRDNVARFEVR